VTDTAGLDFDEDRTGTGVGDVALDQFEGTAWTGNLNDAHFCHKNSTDIRRE
jgi:hypothetical protein